MTGLPIPSLDSFIELCGRAGPLLLDLATLPQPPLFPIKIARSSVSGPLAAEKVRSLKDIAVSLRQLESIAPLFREIETSISVNAPPVEETATVLVSPLREYNAIMTVLRDWESENGMPATQRKHNNHYHLANLNDEFHCLAAAADQLGEMIAAGTVLLGDATSTLERKRFAGSLRAILELHRSELGRIRKKAVRGGVAFAHHKCRLYMAAYPRLAPLLPFDRVIPSYALMRGSAQMEVCYTKRSSLREWLRALSPFVPPDGDRTTLLNRIVALNQKLSDCSPVAPCPANCAEKAKLDLALSHATGSGIQGLQQLEHVEKVFT